jgi:hypothetical protein
VILPDLNNPVFQAGWFAMERTGVTRRVPAVAYRQDDFRRFLSPHPEHDSA